MKVLLRRMRFSFVALKLMTLLLTLKLENNLVLAAPSSNKVQYFSSNANIWPPLQHYDIWNMPDNSLKAAPMELEELASNHDEFEFVASNFGSSSIGAQNVTKTTKASSRQNRVIHLFPVPVDGECLSDDGRRAGNCFNAYECRAKGGIAKGECAMGFGVCCIFLANCNDTISNNITYLVSPSFPSFMPNNFSASSCNFKVQMMNSDISQLRIDFYHFSLGQPNRRNGACDGDVFNISGGPAGTFSLCGQNSGQHIYYDVGSRALPRQNLYGSLRPLTYEQLYPNRNDSNASNANEPLIDITMNFAQRFLPIRLWEIRIAQIPFSQRAPAGCLQYHSGTEGVIQTFNFAENGRHLANQRYRICMRQETEMCSIVYQPCDEQSFRIGPGMPARMPANAGAGGGGTGALIGGMPATQNDPATAAVTASPNPLAASTAAGAMATASTTMPTVSSSTPQALMDPANSLPNSTTTLAATEAITTTTPMTTATTTIATMAAESTTAAMATEAPAESSTAAPATTTTTTTTVAPTSPLSDDVEGSGGGDDFVTPAAPGVSRRPRPVSGGFDLLGLLRSAFDFGLRRKRVARQQQFFSSCTDRITMPCIIEDFIGTGLGPLPGCEPVHCGAQFCSSGAWPCRIESTVTPFYIGVNFGDGTGKGSAEDNIGACLRYSQMQCM